MRLITGAAAAARARTMVCDDSSSMSKTAATPSMWRATIERLRRHIAEMVELAGAARRLDPYTQTAGGCAPSGAAARVVLSLLQTSRGELVRHNQTDPLPARN